MKTDISTYLSSHIHLIEKELDQLIPSRAGPYQQIFESARYAILGGGKRLRPILALTTVQMFGGNVHAALRPACSLELIHTYSMIHDDLPGMDNDDYRRGKLTVHKKYTEGLAILTGDYLLTYAFEVLSRDPHLTAETKVKLIDTLASRCGSDGMIGGQVMDLTFGGKSISIDSLRLLHHNKTASLITASIDFGSILSQAEPSHMANLRQFGESIGLAFQVVDDILDITTSEAKHGKAIASDIRNDKTTYATLLGLEQAKTYANQLFNQALLSLKPLPFDTSLLENLAKFMIDRTH